MSQQDLQGDVGLLEPLGALPRLRHITGHAQEGLDPVFAVLQRDEGDVVPGRLPSLSDQVLALHEKRLPRCENNVIGLFLPCQHLGGDIQAGTGSADEILGFFPRDGLRGAVHIGEAVIPIEDEYEIMGGLRQHPVALLAFPEGFLGALLFRDVQRDRPEEIGLAFPLHGEICGSRRSGSARS